MSKQKTFTITLNFNNNVTKKQEIEIAESIARAIQNEVNNGEIGIAPDNTYTERVEVKPNGSTSSHVIIL